MAGILGVGIGFEVGLHGFAAGLHGFAAGLQGFAAGLQNFTVLAHGSGPGSMVFGLGSMVL